MKLAQALELKVDFVSEREITKHVTLKGSLDFFTDLRYCRDRTVIGCGSLITRTEAL